MSSPQDPSERFQLSDSFASLGDPVEGNPFAVDDPLHQVWLAATRKAEEEVCRITFSALLNLTPSTAQGWPATLIIARFDAWAQRGASVVWSDRAVQHYDQWLVCYANFSLGELARRCTSDLRPTRSTLSWSISATDLARRFILGKVSPAVSA